MARAHKIVVIDDENDIGKFISAAATSLELACAATTDATAFLNELTPETSLILMDLVMPRVDGVELLRLLSARGCKVPIILMSGVGNRVLETAEQLAQVLGLTIAGHLNKPFRLKELQEMLTNSIASGVLATNAIESNGVQEEELREAIEKDEFVLHYQPQVAIDSGAVIGVEALVRWKHPNRGLIFPDFFIGRAEELGLIDQLGWLIYGQALREVGQFADALGSMPMLSLNVSEHSLSDLDFPDRFLSLIERNGRRASEVTIEITETGLMEELSRTLDVLTRLRMKQVSLSIDDFGTGYAMMQQLRTVPATELKIDKSFVQNIEKNEPDRVIVQKTVEIGHQLGMSVIGEGVETQEQLDFLRLNRCDAVQGYLFSRPLPAQDLVTWLSKRRQRQ
jgi:EAL domain-containing protein (putative c-di-GMP-specific phosphodiesterase class I)